ncbi:protein of unknown function [Legionella hackeliae]|uniref:Uncharacterized protein n=1 Tax=Legionella hackeliae TaxID=449 RepID=A0A0A8US62_LEGHA|nr:protein of unknown function [Legionella hackeliae]
MDQWYSFFLVDRRECNLDEISFQEENPVVASANQATHTVKKGNGSNDRKPRASVFNFYFIK